MSASARPRASAGAWARRGLLALASLAAALAAAGATYQAVATERDRHAYPPPGQMVDVGGHRLHLSCEGEGSPTIVFESGLANMSADWGNVQPQVAATTRACAYDRAGIAWSDAGPPPRDPRQIATELHTLLENAGVAGPYVLAGQPFGGLYARMFADRYPDEVAGMVLVDASHPDMWARLPPEVTAGLVPNGWQGLAYRALGRLGFPRLTSSFPVECGLAPRQCAEERAWIVSARRQDAYLAEMGARDRDAQVRATGSLGSRPLVVLTAGDHRDVFGPAYAAQVEPLWRQMQDELAALSTNAAHYVVEGATHGSLQTEDAAVTSAALRQLVGAVRTGQPLLPAAHPPPAVAAAARAEILWDTWGVPHIFAEDVESLFYAYGHAQMHSHGDKVLRLYGIARGWAAEYWGEDYLASDRFFRSIGIPEAGRAGYAAQTPEFRRYLDAFADGVNAYAREHPDRIADEVEPVLPVQGADLLAHMHRVFFTFLAWTGDQTPFLGENALPTGAGPGSNAWAIGPSHSESGNAMLLANPHVPWDVDLVHFYEAQLVAPSAGVDAYGATLIGLPVIAIGFNDFLGWSHTVNTIDGFDTYELDLADGGYHFDGAVRAFQTEQQTLKVRQADGSQREEPLLIRRAVQGPVVTTADGKALAVRAVGLDQHGGLQQWWDMSRAGNLREFEAALQRLQLPMFTVIYADRDGHVLSLFNGRVPVRPSGDFAAWQAPLAGDTSATLWTATHSYADLPRVVDPPSGWVQNSNSPPWYTSVPSPLNPADYPAYLAPPYASQPFLFREQRGIQMLAAHERISFEELLAARYSTYMGLADRLLDELIAAARTSGRPLALRAADVLQAWDRAAEADSRGAVLFVEWAREMLPRGSFTPDVFATPWAPDDPASTPTGLADPEAAVAAVEAAAARVQAAFGSLDVAWGDVNRLRRAGVDLPGNGAPGDPLGVFSTIYYEPAADGRLESVLGDTFVAAVEFTPAGARAMVLTIYGNATQPGSPHDGDQLALRASKQMRPAWRTRAEVEANLASAQLIGTATAGQRHGEPPMHAFDTRRRGAP